MYTATPVIQCGRFIFPEIFPYVWGGISDLELDESFLEKEKIIDEGIDKGIDKGLENAEQKGLTEQKDIDKEVDKAIDKRFKDAGYEIKES